MIEYIRRYFFARAVCKKKGIKFVPKFTKKIVGTYKWRQGVVGFYDKEIVVALFNDNFYIILAHELGHYVDNNLHLKPYKGTEYVWENKDSVKLLNIYSLSEMGNSIIREMKASRNARRILKGWGKYSVEGVRFLSRMFGTYTQHLDRNEIADITYAGQKYIGSDR